MAIPLLRAFLDRPWTISSCLNGWVVAGIGYALRSHLHGSIASPTVTRDLVPRRKSMHTITDHEDNIAMYIRVLGSQNAGGFVCFAIPTEQKLVCPHPATITQIDMASGAKEVARSSSSSPPTLWPLGNTMFAGPLSFRFTLIIRKPT